MVEDVLTTLQDLANYHRNLFNIPVIGITGTNGKTTTKELLGEVLNAKYKTHVTEGNLNNHIGVPLTLLKLTKKHELDLLSSVLSTYHIDITKYKLFIFWNKNSKSSF